LLKEKRATPQTLSLKKNLPLNFKRYLVAQTLFALGNFTYMFFVLKSKIVFDGILALLQNGKFGDFFKNYPYFSKAFCP